MPPPGLVEELPPVPAPPTEPLEPEPGVSALSLLPHPNMTLALHEAAIIAQKRDLPKTPVPVDRFIDRAVASNDGSVVDSKR